MMNYSVNAHGYTAVMDRRAAAIAVQNNKINQRSLQYMIPMHGLL